MGRRVERDRGGWGGGGGMADRASGTHENSCSNSTKRFNSRGGQDCSNEQVCTGRYIYHYYRVYEQTSTH